MGSSFIYSVGTVGSSRSANPAARQDLRELHGAALPGEHLRVQLRAALRPALRLALELRDLRLRPGCWETRLVAALVQRFRDGEMIHRGPGNAFLETLGNACAKGLLTARATDR